MDVDNDDDLVLEDDYYMFLNVARNASIQQINVAYRTLSRMYHPDKHVNNESKKDAELLFNRIKKAYEVLSDPHKRAIYDTLGKKGLEADGWQIINRTKTPSEIREEYEQLAREREQRKLLELTNPKGNITVHVNATDIFNSYYGIDIDGSTIPTIEVSGMSMSQSIEAPISMKDVITLSGSLSSQNGIANGAFFISGRRHLNKGWFELNLGVGSGPAIALKYSRNLSSKLLLNCGTTLNVRTNKLTPGLFGTLAIQLDKHTVGYLTYTAGIQSSMSTILEHNTENHHVTVNCTIGLQCFLSFSYTRKIIENDLKLKISTKVGMFGYTAEYGAEKKISKYSSVYGSVSIGVPTGVMLKLKFVRSSQTFIFPIHLSDEIIPAAIFYATVTPIIIWFVFKKVVLEPMNAENKQIKIEQVIENNRKRLNEKKKEAKAAVELMIASYERICFEENKKKGLIITSAFYGCFEIDSTQAAYDEKTIDVTIPLQCLIKDSKLILPPSSKSELPGFYDTSVGENKLLKIDYVHREKNYYIEISDKEGLIIPVDVSN